MTKEEYKKLEKKLIEAGYKQYPSSSEADHEFYKSFGKDINKYQKGRSLYQICINVYDFSDYATRDNNLANNPISAYPTLMVSRTTDERLDFEMHHIDEIDIESIESIGEKFFQFVEDNFKVEQREEL